jgi:TatD DNase family protein
LSQFVDTHAHIQSEEFGGDVGDVVARAREAGVTGMVVPAVDLATANDGLQLAQRFDGVYTTAGVHPHEASALDAEALAALEALLADDHVVAVGEIGLDFFRMHSSVEEQTRALESMLDLAQRHVMPVIIHCRDAWEAMADQLVPWAREVRPGFGDRPVGVLHYFTGTQDEAERYIDLGFVISAHTSITHPKQETLRQVFSRLPLESLVIETDSPYGAPQSNRGKRNEPSFVVESARQLAVLHGRDLDNIGEVTSATARRLFGLPVMADVSGGHG